MDTANDRQVGGDHYRGKDGGEQHWDRVQRLGMGYMRGQITKYVERCWDKNGIQDLEKARHFLDKYIEQCKVAERRGKAEKVDGPRPLFVRDTTAFESVVAGSSTCLNCRGPYHMHLSPLYKCPEV